MKFELKTTLALTCAGLAGVAIGYSIGIAQGLNFCVDTGLRLLSMDGVVNIGFSDAMKGILRIYGGELL